MLFIRSVCEGLHAAEDKDVSRCAHLCRRHQEAQTVCVQVSMCHLLSFKCVTLYAAVYDRKITWGEVNSKTWKYGALFSSTQVLWCYLSVKPKKNQQLLQICSKWLFVSSYQTGLLRGESFHCVQYYTNQWTMFFLFCFNVWSLQSRASYLLMIKLWTPYLFSILYFPGALRGSTGIPPLYLQTDRSQSSAHTHTFSL